MSDAPNQEIVNDIAKLIMHRLIARRLARDASLVERAKASHACISSRHSERPFVRDWNVLLALSANQLRRLLTSRQVEMNRLRLSSPFVIADGIDFTDPLLRRRIHRAAKRIAERGAAARRMSAPSLDVGHTTTATDQDRRMGRAEGETHRGCRLGISRP